MHSGILTVANPIHQSLDLTNAFEFMRILHQISMPLANVIQLRARMALSLFKDVSLRARRALSLYKVNCNSTLLLLNDTSLSIDNALLVLNRLCVCRSDKSSKNIQMCYDMYYNSAPGNNFCSNETRPVKYDK